MSAQYQVTLEWGLAGIRAAAADVIVIADADRGPETAELHGSAPRTSLVLDATLANASEIAQAALDEQVRIGERASIAIVAAGERWGDESLRPSAADLLVAGRVVDALAELGIDFHDPASAAACAAAVALRGATKSLVAAESAARARAVEAAAGTVGAATAEPGARTHADPHPTADHQQTGADR